jgi:transposase
MWKEVVVAQSEAIYRHLSSGTPKKRENNESGYLLSKFRFERGASKIRNTRANNSTFN